MRFEGLIVMERRIRGVVGLEDSEGFQGCLGVLLSQASRPGESVKVDVAQEG